MSSRVIASPLAGHTLGSGEDDFVIAEWQDAGGTPEPPRFIAPLHLHRNDDEAWYVLQGTLRVRSGDDEVELRAGRGCSFRAERRTRIGIRVRSLCAIS